MKILVGASSGGHTNELLALLPHTDLWPAEPEVYVTTLDILRSNYESRGRTHVIGECDRNAPLDMVKVFLRSLRVVAKERPDAIVTTGSLPLAMVCLWVKVFRGKVVWIDSIAQIDDLSWSGKMVQRFADLAFSQWPEVADRYPKVTYVGQLL